jgi:DNA ligase-1
LPTPAATLGASIPELDMHPITRRRLLAGLAASFSALVAARPARADAGVQLARPAPPGIDPTGYLVSEKLDGVRALWDGRRLRFRSGLPVVAPSWFTARLPAVPLDGELWLGRGRFEELSGIVRRAAAIDAAWRAVRYEAFDLPGGTGAGAGPFAERAERLAGIVRSAGFDALHAVPQRQLGDGAALRIWYEEVLRGGGEGLILHRADALWQGGRGDAVLKLKPVADAEAVVVGHVPGRGRHQGRLGALQVRTEAGIEFLIGTGLTDAQRAAPPAIGSTVTYTHRGLTASGVPRFASFVRVRDPLRS